MDIAKKYCMNPDKTEEQVLVTGINCTPENASDEFIKIQILHGHQNDKIIAHHGWQSFDEYEDITPAEAHEIGIKLIQDLIGDRFQVVVTTHVNTECLHNHFFINAAAIDGGKFHGNLKTLAAFRKKSDELCKANGKSVIINPKKRRNNMSKIDKNGGESYRSKLKSEIDKMIEISSNIDEFYSNLISSGFDIKFGKHIAISPPNMYRNGKRAYIRLRSLKDDNYTITGIENRIMANRYFKAKTLSTLRKSKQVKKQKLPKIVSMYYAFLYRNNLLRPKPKKGVYIRQKQVHKTRENQIIARKISDKIRVIYENKLETPEEINIYMNNIKNEIAICLKTREKLYNDSRKDKEKYAKDIKDITDKISKLRKEIRALSYKEEDLKKKSRKSNRNNKNKEKGAKKWEQKQKQLI